MPNYPYTFQLPPLNVQDIPNDGVAGEFLGINGSGVLDWLTAGGGGTGDMLKADNLSGLTSYPTARTNLGLGTGDSPTFKNLVISAGTLTSDAPVTISQTWNAGSNVMTALKVVATDTASGTTSNLLELWAGSTPALKFSLGKDGQLNLKKLGTSVDASVVSYDSGGLKSGFYFPNSGLDLAWTRANGAVWGVGFNRCSVNSSARFSWSSSNDPLGTEDTILVRDSASGNTLALRNGANAQTFRVYNTYSNAGVDVEYLQLSTTASGFRVGTNSSGSGSSRPLFLGVGGGSQWQINTAGHIGTFGSDNLYDIGASGANRPRNIYVAQTVRANAFQLNSTSHIFGTVEGVIGLYNNGLSDFNRLQFGGTTNLFPAIKRNAAGLDIVLANDSGFAPLAAGAITANLGAIVTGGNLQVGGAAEGRSVGIGIPAAATHSLLIGNGNSATRVQLGIQQSTGQTGNLFEWINSSSAVMGVITTSGNVGIGTTSPTSKLHVVGGNILTDNYVQGQRVFSFLGSSTYAGMDTAGMFTNTGAIGFSANTTVNYTNSCDTFLLRDEAYHLALRNGTNGQKFSVYGTYPGAAWERFTITAPTSGNVLLGTYKGTGGIARGLEFQTDGVTRMTINAAGTSVIFPSGIALQRTDGGGAIFDFTYNGVQFSNTDGLGVSWSTITGPASSKHVGIYGYASEPGVVQINSSVKGTLRDLRCRSVVQQLPITTTQTPTLNGDFVVEATSNTVLTFKLKGTDGTVRSGTITLA